MPAAPGDGASPGSSARQLRASGLLTPAAWPRLSSEPPGRAHRPSGSPAGCTQRVRRRRPAPFIFSSFPPTTWSVPPCPETGRPRRRRRLPERGYPARRRPPAQRRGRSRDRQASPAQGRAGFGGRRGRALLRLISPVVLLVVWQLVSDAGIVSVQKLPPPTQIWSTAVSLVTTD